jgi:hypothetical protein
MYIGQTVPFRLPIHRAKHFMRHGHEFGAADELEYERMADAFMQSPLLSTMIQCIRTITPFDRLRLDSGTRFYGVEAPSAYLKTFMVKDAFNIAYRGGPAGFIAHKCTELRPRG